VHIGASDTKHTLQAMDQDSWHHRPHNRSHKHCTRSGKGCGVEVLWLGCHHRRRAAMWEVSKVAQWVALVANSRVVAATQSSSNTGPSHPGYPQSQHSRQHQRSQGHPSNLRDGKVRILKAHLSWDLQVCFQARHHHAGRCSREPARHMYYFSSFVAFLGTPAVPVLAIFAREMQLRITIWNQAVGTVWFMAQATLEETMKPWQMPGLWLPAVS